MFLDLIMSISHLVHKSHRHSSTANKLGHNFISQFQTFCLETPTPREQMAGMRRIRWDCSGPGLGVGRPGVEAQQAAGVFRGGQCPLWIQVSRAGAEAGVRTSARSQQNRSLLQWPEINGSVIAWLVVSWPHNWTEFHEFSAACKGFKSVKLGRYIFEKKNYNEKNVIFKVFQ